MLLPIWHDLRGGTDLCKSGKEYLIAEVIHFFCTQFQNFCHITLLSINKRCLVIKAQISMLNPCVRVKFGRILGVTIIYAN